jgi:hypothetical protein
MNQNTRESVNIRRKENRNMIPPRPYPSIYSRNPLEDSEKDFQKFIVPEMIKMGIAAPLIQGCIRRIQWKYNYATFTARLTNPPEQDAIAEFDTVVNDAIQSGVMPNRLAVTAYIEKQSIGPVMSYKVAWVSKLVNAFNSPDAYVRPNGFDRHLFRCVSFSSKYLL